MFSVKTKDEFKVLAEKVKEELSEFGSIKIVFNRENKYDLRIIDGEPVLYLNPIQFFNIDVSIRKALFGTMIKNATTVYGIATFRNEFMFLTVEMEDGRVRWGQNLNDLKINEGDIVVGKYTDDYFIVEEVYDSLNSLLQNKEIAEQLMPFLSKKD